MSDERLDKFMDEAVPNFADSMARAQRIVEQLALSDKEKTTTFVLQIEKLSQRLDAAYAEIERLTKLLATQQDSYSRLYNLLEHQLSKTEIINNSNN